MGVLDFFEKDSNSRKRGIERTKIHNKKPNRKNGRVKVSFKEIEERIKKIREEKNGQ